VKSNREEIEMVTKFKLFNKSIKSCGYIFDSNDICLNGNNCIEKHEAKHQPTTYKKIECKCPLKNFSFKCGQYYCTNDLKTCHYYKSKVKSQYFYSKINGCGNEGSISTVSKSFSAWSG